MVNQYLKALPIIRAKIKFGLATFYCRWCKTWHCHGAVSGPRCSHCTSRESPYYGKDYFLEVFFDE